MGTIEVDGLTKRYGDFLAVEDVSFSVGSAQVVGLLGPNGAGKSTIMKILTGFHFPTSGSASIDGLDVVEHSLEVRRRIGYLCESVPLYGDLTVAEYLGFMCGIRRIEPSSRKARLSETIGLCGLKGVEGRGIESLSLGFKQRVGLAQALIHDPPILILDEPTSGLDPNQIVEIRSLIKELGRKKAIILSTHILKEAEALCSSVVILKQGRVVGRGKPEEMAAAFGAGETVWELELRGASAETLRSSVSALAPGVRISRLEDGTEGTVLLVLRVQETPETSSAVDGERLFDWAVAAGCKIVRMRKESAALEDVFSRLTADGGVR